MKQLLKGKIKKTFLIFFAVAIGFSSKPAQALVLVDLSLKTSFTYDFYESISWSGDGWDIVGLCIVTFPICLLDEEVPKQFTGRSVSSDDLLDNEYDQNEVDEIIHDQKILVKVLGENHQSIKLENHDSAESVHKRLSQHEIGMVYGLMILTQYFN